MSEINSPVEPHSPKCRPLSPHLPPEERCCFDTGDGIACRGPVKRKTYVYYIEISVEGISRFWRSELDTPWAALKEALEQFADREVWSPEWRIRQVEACPKKEEA